MTVIATGFERNNVEKNFGESNKKVVVALDDEDFNADMKKIAFDYTEAADKTKVVEFDNVADRMSNIKENYQKEKYAEQVEEPKEVFDTSAERECIERIRATQEDFDTPEKNHKT